MTDIAAITTRYKELHKELEATIKQARDKIKVEAQALISAVFEDFFATNPNVYGIGWTQYTPYWQDGDECTFEVNDINVYLTEASLEEHGFHEGDQGLLTMRAYYAREKKNTKVDGIDAQIAAIGGIEVLEKAINAYKPVKSLLKSIDYQYMEMLYGDHVSVLYTKDGVEVEEFEHD